MQHATSTASTQPQPPTATPALASNGQRLYTSIDQLYQITYPVGWLNSPLISTEGIPNARVFATPDGSTSATVLPLQGNTPAQAFAFVQSYLGDMGDSALTFAPAAAPQTIGGNSWTPQHVTFSAAGAAYQGNTFTTTHQNMILVLVFSAPTAQFASLQTGIFAAMLQSFLFKP